MGRVDEVRMRVRVETRETDTPKRASETDFIKKA